MCKDWFERGGLELLVLRVSKIKYKRKYDYGQLLNFSN